MKRMSEVLNVRVVKNVFYENDGQRWICAFVDEEKAQHATHAINHVDALADALEAMIKSHELVGGATSGYYAVLANAKSALEAYRGAK